MDSSHRTDRNHCSNSNNSNSNSNRDNIGINFQLPSFQLDLNSLKNTFNQNIASNFEELMSFTKAKDVGCDGCGQKFTVFKRKRMCSDCNMNFCSQCLIRDSDTDRKNHCKRCRVLNSVPLDRNALLGLRSRDLKWFLSTKHISSRMCNEKGELVDLIIQSNSPQSNSSNYSNASEYVRPFQNESTFNASLSQRDANESTFNASPSQRDANQSISSNTTSTNLNDSHLATNSNSINSSQTIDNMSPSPSHSFVSQNINESQTKTEVISETTNTRFDIDDLTTAEQLKDLSVKQLKLVLTRHFVDYKGCVEKEELLTKARRLWNDRQETKQQNLDEIPDANMCKICMEATIDCVLLECGHMLTCTNCGKRLNECPICRQYVIRIVHTFKA